MRRREFIAALGTATATWLSAAHAQQPMMPVIGYFNSATSEGFSAYLPALRQGLKEGGYMKAIMSRSNIAGLTTSLSVCPSWRPTSFIDKSG